MTSEPTIQTEAPRLETLDPERRQRVEALVAKLDLADTASVLAFGTDAQRDLTALSEQILQGVRNKDTGAAGDLLGHMLLKVREMDPGPLRNGREPGWFARVVLRRTSPVAAFLQRYEQVQGQLERIQADLEGHRLKMVQDVSRLDSMYEMTLDYFHALEDHILAAAERLRRLDEQEMPALQARAASGGDMLAAQRVSDLAALRADLDRKLHDLRLTRQVTMQSLPSIRLNQELDKALATKIQSVLLNTLPLWKTQLAQAVTLFRTRAAAGVLNEVAATTNRLLEANAENLRAANREVRGVVEQGVFGIDSIEKANQNLIAVIQESIDITAEGSQRRRDAETRLEAAEAALKAKLQEVARR